MDEKDAIENKGFTDQFKADGDDCIIHVRHYFVLTEEERKKFGVEDGQFLVHLFNLEGSKSFKVYLNDQMSWVSDASEFFIDKESIEIIGSIIDERSTLNQWD